MARGRRSQIARAFRLQPGDRARLEAALRSPRLPAGFARRARIILAVASGCSIVEAVRRYPIARHHAYKWLQRYQALGIAGLHDKPGRGRWVRVKRAAAGRGA